LHTGTVEFDTYVSVAVTSPVAVVPSVDVASIVSLTQSWLANVKVELRRAETGCHASSARDRHVA
jgi:hypothetical protein